MQWPLAAAMPHFPITMPKSPEAPPVPQSLPELLRATTSFQSTELLAMTYSLAKDPVLAADTSTLPLLMAQEPVRVHRNTRLSCAIRGIDHIENDLTIW